MAGRRRKAALSFLGFGLPPDIPSWGGMLSREGRQYMEIAPHLALWPGLCLSVVVYSLNMFGDAVRNLLDPACAAGSAATAPGVSERGSEPTSILRAIRRVARSRSWALALGLWPGHPLMWHTLL